MKYALEKDRRRRRIFCRRELGSLGFRVVLRSQLVSPAVRLRLYPAWNGRLQALPGRIRRRCFLTARSGSPVASFGVSRLSFRSLANGGLLAGVVRSSWLFLLLVYGFSTVSVGWLFAIPSAVSTSFDRFGRFSRCGCARSAVAGAWSPVWVSSSFWWSIGIAFASCSSSSSADPLLPSPPPVGTSASSHPAA